MVLMSVTPLNLEIRNSIIITDYLSEGINIVTDCTIIPNSTTLGEIGLYNYTSYGLRLVGHTIAFIRIFAPNNLTIDNALLKTYGTFGAPAMLIDSTESCFIGEDGVYKN
jgi:hypothetical protein